MQGGSARFSTILLVEVEGSQLIRLGAPHSLASGRKEEGKSTRARSLASPRLAWPGRAGLGRWARARDMRVNGPPKSGPRPSGCAASFCYFLHFPFLLLRDQVEHVLYMETGTRVGWETSRTLAVPVLYICGGRGSKRHQIHQRKPELRVLPRPTTAPPL